MRLENIKLLKRLKSIMNKKENENFCRTSIVIVNEGKQALVWLLQDYLGKKTLTFEGFINLNQHDIHHLCNTNQRCCQCTGPAPGGRRVLFKSQLEILFDRSKIDNCKVGRPGCCHPAKKGLTFEELDVTLLGCLLVNFAAISKRSQTDIEKLISYRNRLHAHARTAEITDDEYHSNKADITTVLMNIARTSGKADEMQGKLNQLEMLPFTEALCIKYQNTLLDEIRKSDENSEVIEQTKRKVDELGEHVNETNKRLDSFSEAVVTGGLLVGAGFIISRVVKCIGDAITTPEEKQNSK